MDKMENVPASSWPFSININRMLTIREIISNISREMKSLFSIPRCSITRLRAAVTMSQVTFSSTPENSSRIATKNDSPIIMAGSTGIRIFKDPGSSSGFIVHSSVSSIVERMMSIAAGSLIAGNDRLIILI